MSFGQSSGPACLGKLGKLQQGKFLRTSWSNICQEGLSTTDLAFKLWDWPLEVSSSPVLSKPMKFPTARWEFAQYIVSPSDPSHQLQSGPFLLGGETDGGIGHLWQKPVYKRWTKPLCTELSRNPTAEANFFAYSFQAPFSQLSDQKYPQRIF